MNLELVDKIVNAVLYEGYMLYPYRASAVKNQQRWNFGVLFPPLFAAANPGTESSTMQTQCLLVGNDDASLEVRIRFLHLVDRKVGKVSNGRADDCELVQSLEVDDRLFNAWQEAVEREVVVPAMKVGDLLSKSNTMNFFFSSDRNTEPIETKEGVVAGVLIREMKAVAGSIEVTAVREAQDITKITVLISNTTNMSGVLSRERSLLRGTVSTHTILGVAGGEFVSQVDPPEDLRAAASMCSNVGTYDYPQIAPESAGNLFDGTEIDEILTLRIMTLTEEEKREMRAVDERARQILERTETLPVEQFMKMHGAVRGLKGK
jgi:hydrogenase maturation protease